MGILFDAVVAFALLMLLPQRKLQERAVIAATNLPRWHQLGF